MGERSEDPILSSKSRVSGPSVRVELQELKQGIARRNGGTDAGGPCHEMEPARVGGEGA